MGTREQGNSGWIERRCVWPVSPWPRPRAEGQEVARGSWEDTSPPLCLCIKPLSDTSFKWGASTGPSDGELGGMRLIIQFLLGGTTMWLCLNCTSLLPSLIETKRHNLLVNGGSSSSDGRKKLGHRRVKPEQRRRDS